MSSFREKLSDEDVCSFSEHEVGDICSNCHDDARRDGCTIVQTKINIPY